MVQHSCQGCSRSYQRYGDIAAQTLSYLKDTAQGTQSPNLGYLLPLSLSLCHKGASYEILAVPGTLTDAAANKS